MRWLDALAAWSKAHACSAADLVWPPWCPRCEGRARHPREHLCETCWGALRPLRADEQTWTLGVVGGIPVSASAAFAVDSLFLDALATSKYRGFRAVGKRLTREAAAVLAPLLPAGTLVPVPLRPDKRRARGFNQPEDFALALAHLRELPVETGWLVRTRGGPALAGLPREARERAVHGAFRAGDALPERPGRVLVIDDVVTTGSTALACATVLASRGARVHVAAMGRAFAASGDVPSRDLVNLGRF